MMIPVYLPYLIILHILAGFGLGWVIKEIIKYTKGKEKREEMTDEELREAVEDYYEDN